VRPAGGAVLKGSQWLVASATSNFGVAKVEFELAGIHRPDIDLGVASRTPFGWLGGWDTTTVPNGSYTLWCIAIDSNGLKSASAGVLVTVKN
jgi:hypothetical protein